MSRVADFADYLAFPKGHIAERAALAGNHHPPSQFDHVKRDGTVGRGHGAQHHIGAGITITIIFFFDQIGDVENFGGTDLAADHIA